MEMIRQRIDLYGKRIDIDDKMEIEKDRFHTKL